LSIRAAVEPRLKVLLDQVAVMDRHEALTRAVNALRIVLSSLCGFIDLNRCDPGHGAGHVVADYVNALRLFSRLDIDPKETFIGFLGGVLHDFGCAIIKRYNESSRMVRHAEAAGLLIDEALQNTDLNEAERLLTVYAIMAHTHYLKPQTVGDKVIQPYLDLLPDGAAFYPVWCTRWVDRLDCNGPRFPARHYLTLAEEHEDFNGNSFEIHKFNEAMMPMTKEQAGHPTMLSHMQLFANSQNNHSPYGKWDAGRMVELRDAHVGHLHRIIQAVMAGKAAGQPDENTVLRLWLNFLSHTIEPSDKGMAAADALEFQFRALPANLRAGWIAGFWMTMEEYKLWAHNLLFDLLGLDYHWLQLPLPGIGTSIDVREVIRIHHSWASP
ncbi:hypothetical protein HZA44_01925, partial [Candidatus Peregrinibacteria bacterium]|nr:hypothetical protein [Candidatus Peregrinibacteria bacterium]